MKLDDYIKSKGIEPSTTFFCDYCGLEKKNEEAHLITVAVCEDCYDTDIPSLRSQLAAVTAERDRLARAIESWKKDEAISRDIEIALVEERDGLRKAIENAMKAANAESYSLSGKAIVIENVKYHLSKVLESEDK